MVTLVSDGPSLNGRCCCIFLNKWCTRARTATRCGSHKLLQRFIGQFQIIIDSCLVFASSCCFLESMKFFKDIWLMYWWVFQELMGWISVDFSDLIIIFNMLFLRWIILSYLGWRKLKEVSLLTVCYFYTILAFLYSARCARPSATLRSSKMHSSRLNIAFTFVLSFRL